MRLMPSLAASILTLAFATPSMAAGLQFCEKYANLAVNQFNTNMQINCGLGATGGWSPDYSAHFAWCLTVPENVAKGEVGRRINELNQCKNQKASNGGNGNGNGDGQMQVEFMYKEPMIAGARLDWCRVWQGECGKPAADAFCQAKGHSAALSFDIASKIGGFAPTKVISTGQVCADNGCDGFAFVKCTD